jgi:glucan phosphoethanolaminetransferase (alkaline phosphatase superfamily)
MFKTIQNIKYPLLITLTIQILGLIHFTIDKVHNFLPEGNNEYLDAIYHNRTSIEILSITISSVMILSILFRKENKYLLTFICVVMGIFVWVGQVWWLVFLYPLLLCLLGKSNKSCGIEKNMYHKVTVLELYPLSTLAIVVFFSGFFLMTIQIPFPHVSIKHYFYIQSLSSVLIMTGLLFFFPFFCGFHFLLNKIVKNRNIFEGLFLFLLLLILFAFFYLYFARTFASFIIQLKLISVPFMISGLLCNILLLIIGRIQLSVSFFTQLNSLHKILTHSKFWIKAPIIIFFFRELYGWLYQSGQNLLIEFIYDILNVIFPFFCFWLVLGIIVRFVKRIGNPVFYKLIATILIILAIVPGVFFYKKNWTINLELNRLTSRFYTNRSRNILSSIGLDLEREQSEKFRNLKKSIKELSLESRPDLRDVFKNFSKNEPNTKANDYYLNPPNIFVILSDATYARRLSVYGHSKNTSPVLEKFAKEAVIFKNFYSTSSATFQGVASLFTGKYVGNYPTLSSETRDTLCLSFKKRNYKFLLSTVINTVTFSDQESHCHQESALSYLGTKDSDWEKIKENIEESTDRPIFVYFHLLGGHDPFDLPEDELIFGKEVKDIYDTLLFKADREFGNILERIKGLGLYEDSIIIFSSDHGVGLDKHRGLASYSRTDNANLQIPFLIKLPGVNTSEVSNIYSLIDVRPSLEELLGIEHDEVLHGISFVSELKLKERYKDRCIFGIATYQEFFSMQCSTGVKIIYQRDYEFIDIFNSFNDPWELTSLVNEYNEENFEILARPFVKFMAYGKDTYALTPAGIR